MEPIEEKDLDLKAKFSEKVETSEVTAEKTPVLAEETVERQEGVVEKEAVYAKILSQVKTPQAADDTTVATDAQDANVATDAESKITKLVDLAMQKGVVHAVKVARHLDDNYALDEFHDRLLAEDLHVALVQKGLLKEL